MKEIDVDPETIALGAAFGLMHWTGEWWELTEKGSAYLREWCHDKLYFAVARCCP